ncbi:MAG: alkaline phosphatase PhoX, partial [Verrucomicrobiota bacterium]|nr:alkaline phosphatase PhoX [Verrucomicrobiota bacterium]
MPTRRSFLKQSAITSGFLGLSLYLRADKEGRTSERVIAPYGPLVPDRAKLLDLPADFTYEVISKRGTPMNDGLRVPGRFDDMATFPGQNGRIILSRNHEIALNQSEFGAFPDNHLPEDMNRDLVYDPGEGDEVPHFGGTTTLVYNPATGKTEQEFLSLAGSDRNCSGGTMPWGAWITCEESDDLVATPRGRLHGYCFEVKADPRLGLQKPVALKGLGRFRHEAVACDPGDGSIYLTEDRDD